MPDQVWRGGADQRAQLRQAYRLGARLVQKCGSTARTLEETMDRLRDRATIPSRQAANDQIVPKFNALRTAFMDVQKGLADLLATYY